MKWDEIDGVVVDVQPKLVAVSEAISFKNPKAPVYPRLAQGKSYDEMTVTWTSGYDISEAYPFVEWGMVVAGAAAPTRTAAGTLTFNRGSMCGTHARIFRFSLSLFLKLFNFSKKNSLKTYFQTKIF